MKLFIVNLNRITLLLLHVNKSIDFSIPKLVPLIISILLLF